MKYLKEYYGDVESDSYMILDLVETYFSGLSLKQGEWNEIDLDRSLDGAYNVYCNRKHHTIRICVWGRGSSIGHPNKYELDVEKYGDFLLNFNSLKSRLERMGYSSSGSSHVIIYELSDQDKVKSVRLELTFKKFDESFNEASKSNLVKRTVNYKDLTLNIEGDGVLTTQRLWKQLLDKLNDLCNKYPTQDKMGEIHILSRYRGRPYEFTFNINVEEFQVPVDNEYYTRVLHSEIGDATFRGSMEIFTPEEHQLIKNAITQFKSCEYVYKRSYNITLNRGVTSLSLLKYKDEWYGVKMFYGNSAYSFSCDQFSGLIKFITDCFSQFPSNSDLDDIFGSNWYLSSGNGGTYKYRIMNDTSTVIVNAKIPKNELSRG